MLLAGHIDYARQAGGGSDGVFSDAVKAKVIDRYSYGAALDFTTSGTDASWISDGGTTIVGNNFTDTDTDYGYGPDANGTMFDGGGATIPGIRSVAILVRARKFSVSGLTTSLLHSQNNTFEIELDANAGEMVLYNDETRRGRLYQNGLWINGLSVDPSVDSRYGFTLDTSYVIICNVDNAGAALSGNPILGGGRFSTRTNVVFWISDFMFFDANLTTDEVANVNAVLTKQHAELTPIATTD